MRTRINNKVNIQEEINAIERKIQVKNELVYITVYITSRLNKESFKQAKKSIVWDSIRSEVKRQINKI